MATISRTNRAKQQQVVDPDVEQLAALIQRSRMTDEAIADKITKARLHSMSPDTVRKVREMETKRPQNYTLTWIGWAIGYERKWRKM